MRAILVVMLISTPAILLPNATADGSQIVALLALFGFASLRGLQDAWRLKNQGTFYVAMFVCVGIMALLDAILWMPVTTAIAGISLGTLRHRTRQLSILKSSSQ